MEREGIRRRQKVFLSLLLAVIIGILPTVEVLATDYTYVVSNSNTIDSIQKDAEIPVVVTTINEGVGGKNYYTGNANDIVNSGDELFFTYWGAGYGDDIYYNINNLQVKFFYRRKDCE